MTTQKQASGLLILTASVVACILSRAGTADETDAAQDGGTSSVQRTNQAAEGNVDLSGSRVFVFVPKQGIGHDHAIEGKLRSGRVTLGATKDAGELVFDITSFDADTAAARRFIGLGGATDAGTRREVNTNMLGADVLNSRRFPTATFAVESATKSTQPGKRGVPYVLAGKFTLHGMTRPLSITAELEEKDGKTRLRGSFPLVQTQYGIRPFTKAFGAVGVADRLTVYGDLVLNDTSK